MFFPLRKLKTVVIYICQEWRSYRYRASLHLITVDYYVIEIYVQETIYYTAYYKVGCRQLVIVGVQKKEKFRISF